MCLAYTDSKEIKPVNPKGNQFWLFIGRTDAEAPIIWPPDVTSRLFGKDPDAGKDWGQEEKETTENEMVGWRHWLNGQSLSKLWEIVKDREAWRAAAHGVAKSWTRLPNWTTTEANNSEKFRDFPKVTWLVRGGDRIPQVGWLRSPEFYVYQINELSPPWWLRR